jgi:hypothetical protein
MTDRRPKLPKDVNMIFTGATLPDDVASHCPTVPMVPLRPGLPAAAGLRPEAAPAHAVPHIIPVKDPQLEALMTAVQCEKNHVCYRSGFVSLCRARPMLGGRMLECLERSSPCSHRLSVLHKAICRCRIRKHIAMRLGR